MSLKEFLLEHQTIQVGVHADNWQSAINQAAAPLIKQGFITADYPAAVINNTLEYGAYYVFDEGVAIPHARPENGVLKNCFSLMTLDQPMSIHGSDPVSLIILFGGVNSDAHITDGLTSIVNLLEQDNVLQGVVAATSEREVIRLL